MNKMFQFIMHRILQVVWKKDVTNDTEIFSQLNLFFGLMNWNKKVTQWGSPNLSQFQKVFCLNASDSIFTTIYVPVRSLKIERGFHSPFVSFFNLFYPLRPLMCRKLFVFEKRIKNRKGFDNKRFFLKVRKIKKPKMYWTPKVILQLILGFFKFLSTIS